MVVFAYKLSKAVVLIRHLRRTVLLNFRDVSVCIVGVGKAHTSVRHTQRLFCDTIRSICCRTVCPINILIRRLDIGHIEGGQIHKGQPLKLVVVIADYRAFGWVGQINRRKQRGLILIRKRVFLRLIRQQIGGAFGSAIGIVYIFGGEEGCAGRGGRAVCPNEASGTVVLVFGRLARRVVHQPCGLSVPVVGQAVQLRAVFLHTRKPSQLVVLVRRLQPVPRRARLQRAVERPVGVRRQRVIPRLDRQHVAVVIVPERVVGSVRFNLLQVPFAVVRVAYRRLRRVRDFVLVRVQKRPDQPPPRIVQEPYPHPFGVRHARRLPVPVVRIARRAARRVCYRRQPVPVIRIRRARRDFPGASCRRQRAARRVPVGVVAVRQRQRVVRRVGFPDRLHQMHIDSTDGFVGVLVLLPENVGDFLDIHIVARVVHQRLITVAVVVRRQVPVLVVRVQLRRLDLQRDVTFRNDINASYIYPPNLLFSFDWQKLMNQMKFYLSLILLNNAYILL